MFVVTSFLVVMKFMGETPSFFGYNLYYILTGSMEPELSAGDIIVGKKVDTSVLSVGDVVVYGGLEGETKGKIITHKITDILTEGGDTVFITKGTANVISDPPVKPDQIISRMEFKVPFAGAVFSLVNSRWGFFVIIILPLGFLLAGEIISLVKACKEIKEEEQNETENNDSDEQI